MFKSIYSDYLKPFTFTSAKGEELFDMGEFEELFDYFKCTICY